MAENCPTDCPVLLECDRRIDGLHRDSQRLQREKAILDTDTSLSLAQIRAAQESDMDFPMATGGSLLVQNELDTLRHVASREAGQELEDANHRLTSALERKSEIRTEQTNCISGPSTTLAGRWALFKEGLVTRGPVSELKRSEILHSDPRYLRCGNSAVRAVFARIPKPRER